MECQTVVMSEASVPKKPQKRKRSSLVPEILSDDKKEARIGALRDELGALVRYYKEAMSERVDLDGAARQTAVNSAVAALMEERDDPLSDLVEKVYAEAMEIGACQDLTMAAVKTAVLFVGQRFAYGVPNPDADVLEDRSESSLWCWETRDLKLMPQSVRQVLKVRRMCRKKIHERITAISEMMAALQSSQGDPKYKMDLLKASNKLGKTSSEAQIRQEIEDQKQKKCVGRTQKEAKREELLQIKQLERDKREAEKEKKRLERETAKEKLQSEKEQKRLQEEAEKEEKRRAKEESEIRKQLKKQQEEAEKDQRRREKEEAENKKRLLIQKQASMMERFVKRIKASPSQPDSSSATEATTTPTKVIEKEPDAATRSMDCALSANENLSLDDISKLHFSSWRQLGHSIRSNRKQQWGIRQKPKTELIKQIKLTQTIPLAAEMDESDEEKLVDEYGESVSDDRSCQTNASCSSNDVRKFIRGKQLLQFDKSHRPAFYGKWPQKSQVVGPRHPLRKDPELDYDMDSDEEWEEEDPGESLSDCDKDDEDEPLQDESFKVDDEDESEDGFFVPDGYLSESEGVQVDSMDSDVKAEEFKSSPGVECEEFCALLQKQKYLNNLTERALKKSQPLIISNLMHEKAYLLTAENLVGIAKLEQMCLQAMSMRVFPGSSLVEISLHSVEFSDQEVSPPRMKDSATPNSTANTMTDSDLLTLVSTIQSCSQGIHKLAECLQPKLPAFSKSQLRNKVREVSDFAENRWQVKKEVLLKLGLSTSPEKSSGRTKGIAAFFSKRCLPPTNKSMNPNETSPQPTLKTSSAMENGHQSLTQN